MPIRGVIFDIGDTLLTQEPLVGSPSNRRGAAAIAPLVRPFLKTTLTDEQLAESFGEALQEALVEAYQHECALPNAHRILAQVLDAMDWEPSDEAVEVLLPAYFEPWYEAMQPRPQAVRVLQLLREAGLRLAAIANVLYGEDLLLERLRTLPISSRLIREIHERLLHGVRGSHMQLGELRTRQNWIGPAGCALQEATFVPPPHREVPMALGDLETFIHSPGDLPALVQIGLVHAQFETIHPFLDGNGRVGRLLITFLLCQREILRQPVLYLSHFFRQHRSEYYQRLQAVHDAGDWEGWLAFFLRGVADVSAEATQTVQRVLTLREEHRNLVTERLGRAAANGHRVLERLYRQPFLSVSGVQAIIGTSYAPANRLVVRLADLGILEEITGDRRNRVYRYTPYMHILEDTTI